MQNLKMSTLNRPLKMHFQKLEVDVCSMFIEQKNIQYSVYKNLMGKLLKRLSKT